MEQREIKRLTAALKSMFTVYGFPIDIPEDNRAYELKLDLLRSRVDTDLRCVHNLGMLKKLCRCMQRIDKLELLSPLKCHDGEVILIELPFKTVDYLQLGNEVDEVSAVNPVEVKASKIDYSKPICPDHRNCPGWVQGYGCDNCEYRPV